MIKISVFLNAALQIGATLMCLPCFTGYAGTCDKHFLLEKLYPMWNQRAHNLFCLFKTCWNKCVFLKVFLHIFQMSDSLELCAFYYITFMFLMF